MPPTYVLDTKSQSFPMEGPKEPRFVYYYPLNHLATNETIYCKFISSNSIFSLQLDINHFAQWIIVDIHVDLFYLMVSVGQANVS